MMIRTLACGGLWTALALSPCTALADVQFPAKPIRLVIGFPPGGPTDIIGRAIAQSFPKVTGQPMIVDNRGGANGIVGAEIAAKSPPDGYTVHIATTGALLSPIILPKLTFDLQRDFAPVTLLATVPMVLVVHPSLPTKTAGDLVALAKHRPGEIAYSSSGNASMGNLSMESFKLVTGIRILHVPYKGAAPSVAAVVAGEVQAAILALPPLLPQVKAGRVRTLAVTSSKRSTAIPGVPTMVEIGYPDAGADNWFGMFVPAATPVDVRERLHAIFVQAMQTPETETYLAAQGVDVIAAGPADFATFLRNEHLKWRKVIKATGITAQ